MWYTIGMSDVSKAQGLFKPKGINVFYYRRRVPLDLVALVGKRELKQSLKTSDIKEAKSARNRLAAEWDDYFRRLRTASGVAIDRSPRRSAELSLLEIDSAIERYVETCSVQQERDLTQADWRDETEREDRIVETYRAIAHYENPGADATRMDIASLERMIFGDAGVRRSLTSAERERIEELLRRAMLEIERRALALLKNRFDIPAFDERFRASSGRIMALRDLSKQYLADYEKSRRVGPKRTSKVARDHAMILEFFGPEIAVKHIDRRQCREFRDMLGEFPAHASQHFAKDELSLAQILSEARKRGLKSLARNTQDTYLRSLKMLLEWAKQEGVISSNPSDGLEPKGERSAPNEARDPFTAAQLTAIFAAPLYTGCENDADGYAQPGTAKPRGTRFWIPLIGLFTGMRLNEICQLRPEDVRTAVVPHISVNDSEGKRVKNRQSRRHVPIHPELQRVGFLDFVSKQQARGLDKLFPDIKKSKHGYMSERMSRWFNEGFLPKLIAKGPKTTFHSFRHTMQDAMRDAGLSAADRGAICGWNEEKSAGANYGSGASVERLYKELERVIFRVDVSHLYA